MRERASDGKPIEAFAVEHLKRLDFLPAGRQVLFLFLSNKKRNPVWKDKDELKKNIPCLHKKRDIFQK